MSYDGSGEGGNSGGYGGGYGGGNGGESSGGDSQSSAGGFGGSSESSGSEGQGLSGGSFGGDSSNESASNASSGGFGSEAADSGSSASSEGSEGEGVQGGTPCSYSGVDNDALGGSYTDAETTQIGSGLAALGDMGSGFLNSVAGWCSENITGPFAAATQQPVSAVEAESTAAMLSDNVPGMTRQEAETGLQSFGIGAAEENSDSGVSVESGAPGLAQQDIANGVQGGTPYSFSGVDNDALGGSYANPETAHFASGIEALSDVGHAVANWTSEHITGPLAAAAQLPVSAVEAESTAALLGDNVPGMTREEAQQGFQSLTGTAEESQTLSGLLAANVPGMTQQEVENRLTEIGAEDSSMQTPEIPEMSEIKAPLYVSTIQMQTQDTLSNPPESMTEPKPDDRTDYTTGNLSVGLGELGSVTIGVSEDRYKQHYFSVGPGIGKGWGVSGSIVYGNVVYMDPTNGIVHRENLSQERMKEYMTGWSTNMTAGAFYGGGYTAPDGSTPYRSVERGIYTPQAGFSRNYTWSVDNFASKQFKGGK